MSSSRYKINPLVLIGVPTLSDRPLSWDWTDHYMGLTFPLGVAISRARVHDQRIDNARNTLVEQALEINATYILFLSDDVLAPSNTFDLLHRHREMMVTGVYWEKKNPTHPYLWNGLMDGPYEDWKAGEYFPIAWAGVDCLLVHTDVFRAIEPPWFSLDYAMDGTQKAVLATEDLYFYTKAKAAGFQLYCDAAVQCDHQDRGTLRRYGLTEDMPQFPGSPFVDPGAVRVADIGSGHDSPFFGPNVELVRFDGDPETKPDVRCDIRALPAPDDSFDIAHMRHVLEHFAPFETLDVVDEAVRILKPGGRLIVEVPNVAWAARQILAVDDAPDLSAGDYPMWQMYGRQNGSPFEVHRQAFTRHGLRRAFEHCGLTDVEVTVSGPQGENLHAEGVKAPKVPYVIADELNQIAAKADAAAEVRAGRGVEGLERLASSEIRHSPAVVPAHISIDEAERANGARQPVVAMGE